MEPREEADGNNIDFGSLPYLRYILYVSNLYCPLKEEIPKFKSIHFKTRPCISIRGSVRPSVGRSVCPSVHLSVRPSVRLSRVFSCVFWHLTNLNLQIWQIWQNLTNICNSILVPSFEHIFVQTSFFYIKTPITNRCVSPHELSLEQVREATHDGTCKFPISPKLISTHEEFRKVGFVQSILYHLIHLSFRITKVIKARITCYISVCLSVCLTVCLSDCIFIYLSICHPD